MAYRNLYSPLSQFVDPGSTEISETLRERYLLNFQKQDAISESMAQLPVASFANDQAIFKDLYQNTRGKLDELAERGDYENMFIPVQTLAQQYRDTATPLAKNYELYQADIEEKEKLLEEGKITMSDYQGWLKKSRMTEQGGDYVPYAGLEFDERGRAKVDSYYGNTPIAQYVDVQGEILSALNDIPEIKRGGFKVKGYEQGPDGIVYTIEKDGVVQEYVPQEAVMAVTQNILNRPDVSAYMLQSADFGTLDMGEANLNAIISKHITDLRDEDENETADKLEGILSTGSAGMKRQAARGILYNNQYANYLGTALATRQASEYGGGYSISFDKAYNEKLEENNLNTGNYTVVLPGGEHVNASQNIANEAGVVSPTTINQNIDRLRASDDAAIQAAVQVIPEMQELVTSRNRAPLNERLRQPNAVKLLTEELLRINPELDADVVKGQLARTKAILDYNTTEIEMSQRLLRMSYGDFPEIAGVDAVTDIAVTNNVPVNELGNLITSQLNADYIYDEETNSINVIGGQAPSAGADVAARIVATKEIISKLDAQWSNSMLKNANVDKLEFMSNIVAMTFDIEPTEAEELIRVAQGVNVTKDLEERGGGRRTTTTLDSASRLGGEIGSAVRQKMVEADTASKEYLESKAQINYAMGITDRALADDNKGTMSKEINDALKGVTMDRFLNVPVVPTTSNPEAKIVLDLLKKEGAYQMEIADVDFTQVNGPTGLRAALVLKVKKSQGADRDFVPPVSSITMLYDDVIAGFDPTMKDRINNTFNSPAGLLINNALSLMMNIPGAVTPEEGITIRDTSLGRDLEITLFPEIRPLNDENLNIIAGIQRVEVKATGGGEEPYEETFSLEQFKEFFNTSKALSNV